MKFKLLCLSLLLTFFCKAQTNDLFFLKGKVVAQIKELNGISVYNQRSESTTETDESGNFFLFVKVNDTLKISGLQIVSAKVKIKETDISKTILAINLKPKVFELNEVKINEYPEINAVSLGILKKPAKKYTPAERRLRTAGDFQWYYPLLIPFGGMPVDGLINAITGRTIMLKKELEIEKKERLKKKIENSFDEIYFTKVLKIPAEYVEGFLYFAVENEKLKEVMSQDNSGLIKFQLGELAVQYLEIISEKKIKSHE